MAPRRHPLGRTGLAVATLLVGALPNATASGALRHRTSSGVATLTVAVTIGFGRGHHRITRCVKVPKGTSAAGVLEEALVAARALPLTTDVAWPGFICSIDGVPSSTTTCLTHFSAAAPTWSFWTSSAAHWHYSSVGAFSVIAAGGSAEAWQLEPGTGAHGRFVTPAVAPSFATLCASQTAARGGVTATVTNRRTNDLLVVLWGIVILGLGLGARWRSRRTR